MPNTECIRHEAAESALPSDLLSTTERHHSGFTTVSSLHCDFDFDYVTGAGDVTFFDVAGLGGARIACHVDQGESAIVAYLPVLNRARPS